MRTEKEIQELMTAPYKQVEQKLGIKIRNGQAIEGIRKTLNWVQQTGWQNE